MTNPNLSKNEKQRVKHAKGAAREAIGKLIGDDAEVSTGRAEQENADRAAHTKTKQED